VETDLNRRIFDGRYEHRVTLHQLSGVDDFASTSMTETGVIDRLDATVPNVPFSAAIFDGTYFQADPTRDNDAATLRDRVHDEVTHAWLHSHIALWSREYYLREKTDAEHAGITTRVCPVVLAPGIVILTLG
jgi:hypothetical protein